MSPNSQNDRAQFGDLVTRAEEILASVWGAGITLSEVERVSANGRRNVLLRAKTQSHSTLPTSVFIKQANPANYDANDSSSRVARGLFRDWSGLQFLQNLEPNAACPRFLGGDRARGFFIMEDLRASEHLEHVLTCGNSARAEQALRQLVSALGAIHARTMGRVDEYQQIRAALGDADHPSGAALAHLLRNYFPVLDRQCRALGVTIADHCRADLEAVAQAMESPGAFLAYTHADPCPDNCLLVDGRLYLIDFEFGDFRHALLDGAYPLMRFPNCQAVRDIPRELLETIESDYREELRRGCPEADDDALFFCAVADACAFWVVECLAHLLPDALASERAAGLATNRQRLVTRLEAFVAMADRSGHLPGLSQTLRALGDELGRRWQTRLPVYDAFLR